MKTQIEYYPCFSFNSKNKIHVSNTIKKMNTVLYTRIRIHNKTKKQTKKQKTKK